MGLWLDVPVLLGAAGLLYLAGEFFVNAVEWLGRKLAVGAEATGTVLAALGTALPETVITLVAVIGPKGAPTKDLGVGAALGGPLVLSTIAYCAVGLTLIVARKALPRMAEDRAEFARLGWDQAWFLVISLAKVGLGLIAFAAKPLFGGMFLIGYGLYVWRELRGPRRPELTIAPLKLQPGRPTPTGVAVAAQTLAAVAVIFIASRLFVGRLEHVAQVIALRPQLAALLLSPIATEMPETVNAVIWARQGKHRLALANIVGAMMVQATIPTALGLFFTAWRLEPPLLVAAAITSAAVAIMQVPGP